MNVGVGNGDSSGRVNMNLIINFLDNQVRNLYDFTKLNFDNSSLGNDLSIKHIF